MSIPLEIGSARAGVNRLWARRKIASIMDQRARGVPEDVGPYFWWEGPDGSRVLAYSPVYGYSADLGPRVYEVIERWRELTGDDGESGDDSMLFLYGRGDHGGGGDRHPEGMDAEPQEQGECVAAEDGGRDQPSGDARADVLVPGFAARLAALAVVLAQGGEGCVGVVGVDQQAMLGAARFD